jgi:aldose 1-epimerase
MAPPTLIAADLEAVFWPAQGMLGASLRHRGTEILRRVDDLRAAATRGSTAGIPLLHPWANRLDGTRYRAAGRQVRLDPSSPLLHLDARGLPIHGVPWSRLEWRVTELTSGRLSAVLEWSGPDLLAVFPFPHRMNLTAVLEPDGLTLVTTLVAGSEGAVPVSFGFHPYFGLAGVPRAKWRLESPEMRRLVVDERGIPTGDEVPFAAFSSELGERGFDDGFALGDPAASFALIGGGRRVTVEFLDGYLYAQIFAPKNEDLIAIEPMTAPTSALSSGRGLRIVEPGQDFQAAFRIRIDFDPAGSFEGPESHP